LIELGRETPAVVSSISTPAVTDASHRQLVITPAGDEIKPSPPLPVTGPPLASLQSNPPWKASTDRFQEIHEQHSRDATTRILEEGSNVVVNREWRWGGAMNSTIILQSEYEEYLLVDGEGMRGLRDMLKGLTRKRNHVEPVIPSSMSP
jgi:hypothetical protein